MTRKLSQREGGSVPVTPEIAFGRIVRRRRKELGLRQWDLEGEETVSQAYISMIEHGKQQPCLRAIMHLEQKLEFEPGELLRRVWEVLREGES